jgi:hypothetical protein
MTRKPAWIPFEDQFCDQAAAVPEPPSASKRNATSKAPPTTPAMIPKHRRDRREGLLDLLPRRTQLVANHRCRVRDSLLDAVEGGCEHVLDEASD